MNDIKQYCSCVTYAIEKWQIFTQSHLYENTSKRLLINEERIIFRNTGSSILHFPKKIQMKKTISNLAITGFITVTFLTACNSPAVKVEIAKDKVKDAKENVAEAKIELKQSVKDSIAKVQSDSLNLLQKFRKESDEKINDNEKKMVELNKNILTAKKDLKASYQKSVNDLERRNDNLKARLAGYKDDQKENFEAFKNKFNSDMDEVTKSLNEIHIKS